MGQLERWVNELQIEIDAVKKKLATANFSTGIKTLSIFSGEMIAGYPSPVNKSDIDKCALLCLTIYDYDDNDRIMFSQTINRELWVSNKTFWGQYFERGAEDKWHVFESEIRPEQLHPTSGNWEFMLSVDDLVYPTLGVSLIGIEGDTTTPPPNLLTRAISAVKKVTKKRTTKKKGE